MQLTLTMTFDLHGAAKPACVAMIVVRQYPLRTGKDSTTMTESPANAADGRDSRTAPARDTYVFDIPGGRRGAAINRLCASLKYDANRREFLADEEAYCNRFHLELEQRRAVLERDWTAMLDMGASIFYTFKLAQVDKRSMQYLGGVFSGMTEEEFTRQMRSGGRTFG